MSKVVDGRALYEAKLVAFVADGVIEESEEQVLKAMRKAHGISYSTHCAMVEETGFTIDAFEAMCVSKHKSEPVAAAVAPPVGGGSGAEVQMQQLMALKMLSQHEEERAERRAREERAEQARRDHQILLAAQTKTVINNNNNNLMQQQQQQQGGGSNEMTRKEKKKTYKNEKCEHCEGDGGHMRFVWKTYKNGPWNAQKNQQGEMECLPCCCWSICCLISGCGCICGGCANVQCDACDGVGYVRKDGEYFMSAPDKADIYEESCCSCNDEKLQDWGCGCCI